MAPDCMRVRLHLRLIGVLAVVVDTTDQLRVEVESTRRWSRWPTVGASAGPCMIVGAPRSATCP